MIYITHFIKQFTIQDEWLSLHSNFNMLDNSSNNIHDTIIEQLLSVIALCFPGGKNVQN